jgi:hypothetical protein
MNTINRCRRYSGLFILLISTLLSCKKNNYLVDGGTVSANTSLSTYDYLKANKYHYFDSTLLLIDHFNLKDSINKAGTFFAFTDFAINLFMRNRGYTSMEQLYDSVSSKFLTQYMFGDSTLSLAHASTVSVQHANWANDTSAISAIIKVPQSYTVYLTNTNPTFNYYVLQYVKVNGALDGSPGAPAGDKTDTYLSCQTTGIRTSTGTTLHVLVNNAQLNRL